MEEKDKKSALVASLVFVILAVMLWLFNLLKFRSSLMNFPLFASIYAISLLFINYARKELGIKVTLTFVLLLIAASSISIIIAASQIGITNLINYQTMLLFLMLVIPTCIIAYEA